MRVFLRKFLTLVLCIVLMPGWLEVIENVEHLLHDGHLAHIVGHDDDEDVASHDALEAEHGCTPVSHTCSCHSSIPVILQDNTLDFGAVVSAVLRDRSLGLDDHPGHRANAPPIPRPRA